MLVSAEKCMADLRCPITHSRLTLSGDMLVPVETSPEEARSYPVHKGVTIVIDFEQSIVDRDWLLQADAASSIERTSYTGLSYYLKRLLSPDHKSTHENVSKLKSNLLGREAPAKLLVIGGGSIGRALAPLYHAPEIDVYSFDIYASQTVQFVADAHNLPFEDGFFDGVVIQAVLEHVLDPNRVVAEIRRVLKHDGMVFAESPFIQHVHEGAYDFTRFTDSGHRYLFKGFEAVDTGVCGGPGVQLMWSADYFARSLFRSRTAGKVAKLLLSWAQFFDRFIPDSYARDAACGVYFLGTKTSKEIGPAEIVEYYRGAH